MGITTADLCTLAKFVVETSATVKDYVLALVTLSDATHIGSFSICVALPNVAKACTVVTVAYHWCWHFWLNKSTTYCQWKYCFNHVCFLVAQKPRQIQLLLLAFLPTKRTKIRA
jgi:hypothetical protein